uniref:Uncharacterized protein n=1 Tax=Octactis speculum TaxID=3111310 RepID=A0A7S2B479_9STRA|mmetsp:Transcript_192/g.248  ORF Transcript_192/g.248 Transcript_192/m.248 type:complete len:113 (+) Transcript_192:581-919(+)
MISSDIPPSRHEKLHPAAEGRRTGESSIAPPYAPPALLADYRKRKDKPPAFGWSILLRFDPLTFDCEPYPPPDPTMKLLHMHHPTRPKSVAPQTFPTELHLSEWTRIQCIIY